ncbi:hypothetical protein ACWEOH_03870 [Agromyces sp. NPDC004153]
MLALAACSPSSPSTHAVGSAEASGSATPTPTVDPGPVELTTEEAAARYLNIVCPTNAAANALNAAFRASEEEFLNGGAPDPAGVKAAAQAQMTSRQTEAELFDDDYYEWPESIEPHITTLRDSDVAALGTLSAMVNAPDYETAYYAVWPDQTAPQASAQEIRFQLGIGADTQATCVGYEGGHDVLVAERREREAALSNE